jgi:hypothetical protein
MKEGHTYKYKGVPTKEYHAKIRLRNPEQMLLSSARNRAKKRGIEFDLTVDDIKIPGKCPILGVQLTRNIGEHGGTKYSASLDRIVPELGYVKGNVRVVSMLANNMKSNATNVELLLFSKWVLENIK